jgi:hypothetical protein
MFGFKPKECKKTCFDCREKGHIARFCIKPVPFYDFNFGIEKVIELTQEEREQYPFFNSVKGEKCKCYAVNANDTSPASFKYIYVCTVCSVN